MPEMVQARKPPIIHSIKVEGQRKVEKDAILARISLRPGKRLNTRKIRDDISSIYDLGFFYDVKVLKKRRGRQVSLIYQVVEKPSITKIIFKGNEEFERSDLMETTGIKLYEVVDMNRLQEAAKKIEKEYEDKGYFLARVKLSVKPIKKEQTVQVIYDITENEKVKVRRITITGNKKIPDSKIKGAMETKEGTYFGFISGAGSYKQEAFDRDFQRIRYLYLLDGYVQVKMDSPQIYVTPDKKNIYITINIQEGKQFFIGDIDFSGDLLFDRQELLESSKVIDSEVFSYQILQEDIARLTAKYGNLGYAFTNVIPRTRLDDKNRKVHITFEIDKGNKVYFGEISIIGNSKTRDKVIRRELRIYEGELYNETAKRVSLANIQRLGFFEDVNFKTFTPIGQPEKLNIEVEVKERNTGTINIGAGYGSTSGFQFEAQIDQMNFLGRGQRLGFSVRSNSQSSTYNLNFTEPYFLDTRWSLGTDIYKTETRSPNLDYQRKTSGGALRFGHPIGNYLAGELRFKIDNTHLIANTNFDESLYPINEPGQQGSTHSVALTVVYDKRNDRFAPSRGFYARSSLEYAGLGGDLKYTLGRNTLRYYRKLFWKVVWRNNISYSFITPHGEDVPFSKRFLLGGSFDLKGFEYAQVGKRKFSDKFFNAQLDSIRNRLGREPTQEEIKSARTSAFRPFGGTKAIYYTMELEWPLLEAAGIKGVLFYDIGAAEDVITSSTLLSDWGVGLRWFSPVGPLRFELGFPINPNPSYHKERVFNFTIGSPF